MSRPLLDTTPDNALFVGRHDELERAVAAARAGRNVLLTGERGIGLTSLAHQVLRRARRARPPLRTCFVNAAMVDQPDELIDAVLPETAVLPEGGVPYSGPAAYRHFAGHGTAAPTLAVVDNLTTAVAHTTFGRLRDEVWSLPITWLVACPSAALLGFLEPPADVFFDVVSTVPLLTDAEARELIHRRLGTADLSGKATRAVLGAGAGNPRALVRALAAVQAGRTPQADVVSRISQPASALLSELRATGPASASDVELQRRLGWTRARLTQVFGELSRAGLVRAGTVKSGIGRPRTVYRIDEPDGS